MRQCNFNTTNNSQEFKIKKKLFFNMINLSMPLKKQKLM